MFNPIPTPKVRSECQVNIPRVHFLVGYFHPPSTGTNWSCYPHRPEEGRPTQKSMRTGVRWRRKVSERRRGSVSF